MYDDRQTSIATFGYRRAPVAQAGDIVHAIDEMLQNSDAQPRQIHWVSAEVARAGAVSLCRDHALFAGLSSGAAYAVAGEALRGTPTGPRPQMTCSSRARLTAAVRLSTPSLS